MWRFLGRMDEDIARSAQAEGCLHCGGPLHRSDCGRACWGLPMELRGDRRLCGLRCGRCGVRRPVESVRFFGRQFGRAATGFRLQGERNRAAVPPPPESKRLNRTVPIFR